MQKGYLSISKTSENHKEDYISISATNMKAGEPGMIIKVSIADFAEAIFGRGFRPCEYGERGEP